MPDQPTHRDPDDLPDIDPQEFLRSILHISPEDAERVREAAPATRKKPGPQDGPTDDYGEK